MKSPETIPCFKAVLSCLLIYYNFSLHITAATTDSTTLIQATSTFSRSYTFDLPYFH